MIVLVLGGRGFLGRHVVAALSARGHGVIVGTRDPNRVRGTRAMRLEHRSARLERLTFAASWVPVLRDVDAVVNCVGILRQRGAETYERVHHRAPAALVQACARLGIRRLVHVSALGLAPDARSEFNRSKHAGEGAIRKVGSDPTCRWTLVRPALLDGEGGYGARWLRRVARWPVHFVPRDANGRLAVVDVRDAGEAIAILAEQDASHGNVVAELGGERALAIDDYLALLRECTGRPPARRILVPAWLARATSHLCDLAHLSPFSYGHLELMRRDNLPQPNALPGLLGRPPRAVDYFAATRATFSGDQPPPSARARSTSAMRVSRAARMR